MAEFFQLIKPDGATYLFNGAALFGLPAKPIVYSVRDGTYAVQYGPGAEERMIFSSEAEADKFHDRLTEWLKNRITSTLDLRVAPDLRAKEAPVADGNK